MKKQSMTSALLFFCLAVAFPLFALDYSVGEGDVVKIKVYGHDDLTTVERVSGAGTIKFPLIGVVGVEGLSVSGLSEKIASLLADGYIVMPQVSVFIEEFRSQKTAVMGEVKNPGLYELKGNTTFHELLSMTGGLTKEAGDTAIIKRMSDEGSAVVNTIDLKRLLEEGDSSLNIPVFDGDTVYISRAGVVYVTGEVKKPDSYTVKEGTTVIQAVTMAGGLSDKAAEGRIRIIRKIDGVEKVIKKVKMDEKVLPDDVIVVPESYF